MTAGSEAHCPWCRFASTPEYRDRLRRMAVCAGCGAWFVWPAPSAGDLLARYEGKAEGMPAELREWRRDTSQGQWYEHLARRIRTIAGRDVASVVDVGAGGLELTTKLANVFPGARVEAWDLGIKPVVGGRIASRAVDLNQPDPAFESGDRFDIVACVAVIEHVLDPAALLRRLHGITRAGGFVYVAGPEVNSIAHRVLRGAWPYYSPDDHLTLPSLSSIERAVAAGAGGKYELRRISVRYSLKYLMRFLRLPIPVPSALDFALPIPSGAFELIWWRSANG